MVLSDDFYYQPIRLDTINTQIYTDLIAKEGDAGGRGLKVTITENGVTKNTTGITLNLKWEHTAVADLQGLEPFEAVDLTKGIYKLKYPTNMLHKGTVKALIQIIDNGGLAGSRNLKIKVDSTVGDDTAMESSNEFTALVTAMVKTNHMENLLNETIANVTVDSEVITARNSTAKGKTFTVLDERIEEIEDDTYFPATNALVSPDFEATTGWTADKATLAVANNVASVTGNGTDAYANLYQSNTNVAVIGDKVYLRVRARVTNALCTSLQLSTTSFAQPIFINNPVANQWYDIYDVIDATATNAILTIRANYADAATANGKVMQVEKPVKINLTTAFGLLTPTVEQMYSLMSQFTNGHFKGTASLSQPALVLAKTLSMEAQFNAAVAGLTVDDETINARVGEDSTTHATLKARLDSEKSTIDNSLVSLTSQLAEADTSIIGSKHLTDTVFLSAKENSLKFIPNSENYLTIPTPDATNQTVHPKVLYFKDGWNGYKFWMAHTPYAFADNTLENPCIAVSADGTTWIEPPGLTNPIDAKPAGTGNYNSDVHLVMVGSTMECWWRAVISEQTVIKRRTSTDGVTWSAAQTMITTTTSGCLSPAILYEDAKYKMWYVDGDIIKYVESANGDTLAGARTLDIEYTFDANTNEAWHIDVIKTNELIEMLIYVRPEGTLHYATSSDNVNFSLGVEVIRPRYYDTTMFDCKSTYRSSLVRVGDLYYVYYTGIMFDNAHHIGLIKGHSMDKLGLSSSKEITIYADGNSHTASDSIQKYKKYAITTTNITYLMQASFPEAKPGQLITDNSIPEYGRQTQKYVLYNSDIYYTRRTKTDGTWTTWVKHNSTETVDYIADTVTPSTPIGQYPNDKVSYHIIGSQYGVDNAFPEYSGGLLVTYNIKSAEAFWQYQTYVTYQHKHYYIRFVNTNGAWSGWNLIDTNFNGTTANRPTSARRVTGMCYFDHNLLKPIWWDGSAWRDATGTVVV